MAKITTEEIQLLAKYIYNISGIYLDQSKDYLLEGRLRPLLQPTAASLSWISIVRRNPIPADSWIKSLSMLFPPTKPYFSAIPSLLNC